MTYLTRTLTSFAVVGAMFLFGSGSGLGPDGAWAQTASKLKCKRCVGARQLKKGAIKTNRMKDGAVNLNKMESGLGERANTSRPFYVTADTNGAQATILTHGPITIFMRCLINDAGSDRIQLFATSSLAGWVTSDNDGPFAAGQEVLMETLSTPTGTVDVNDIGTGDAAITPDGYVADFSEDTLTGAFNTLGHICTLTGVMSAFKGTP